MARRHAKYNSNIVGRALLYQPKKVFVRSYVACSETDLASAGRDPILEQWLIAQGYKHVSMWPDGVKLRRIEAEAYDSEYSDFIAPYIDGGGGVNDEDSYLRYFQEDYEFACNNTNGFAREWSF